MQTIQVPRGKEVVFIGDIHEKEWHFDEMVRRTEIGTKRIGVFVGDFLDKGDGLEVGNSIIRKVTTLARDGWAYAVRGNHEAKHIRHSEREGEKLSDELKWCQGLPLALSFLFSNQNRITVLHAGVTPKHTWADLSSNTELMYIRTLDEKNRPIPLIWVEEDGNRKLIPKDENGVQWHERYDGRFGFIISGHDSQKDGVPKFYKHSCNLDTRCYETGILTGQIVSDGKLTELVTVQK